MLGEIRATENGNSTGFNEARHPAHCRAMTTRWSLTKMAIENCLIASAVSSGYFKPASLIQGRRRHENFHFDICCNSSICLHCPSFCWRHREKKGRGAMPEGGTRLEC